jgi:Flp pilus assembly pilin Flp
MKKSIEKRSLKSLLNATEGLSTVEYIIILVLIAIVGMAAWSKFGTTVKAKIEGSQQRVGSDLDPNSR